MLSSRTSHPAYAVRGTRYAVAEVAQIPAGNSGGLDGGTQDREALERVPQKLTQEIGARQQQGWPASEGEVDGAVRGEQALGQVTALAGLFRDIWKPSKINAVRP